MRKTERICKVALLYRFFFLQVGCYFSSLDACISVCGNIDSKFCCLICLILSHFSCLSWAWCCLSDFSSSIRIRSLAKVWNRSFIRAISSSSTRLRQESAPSKEAISSFLFQKEEIFPLSRELSDYRVKKSKSETIMSSSVPVKEMTRAVLPSMKPIYQTLRLRRQISAKSVNLP